MSRSPLFIIVNEREVRRRAAEYDIGLDPERVVTISDNGPRKFAATFGRLVAPLMPHDVLPRPTLASLVKKLSQIPLKRFTWERVRRLITCALGKQMVKLIASGQDLIEARRYLEPAAAL